MTNRDDPQTNMDSLLGIVTRQRSRPSDVLPKPVSRQAHLGQFMTPPSIARFMASMFTVPMPPKVMSLEAGAGRAALARAFVDRWARGYAGVWKPMPMSTIVP